MNMSLLRRTLAAVLLCGGMQFAQAQVTLNFDAGRRGPVIGDRHYGIFFEEINHAGDGGLYAELIRNRSFEDNGGSVDSWIAVGNATMGLATDGLLNDVQRHALELTLNAAGDGVRNEGFWGINAVSGITYKLSFWAKAVSAWSGTLTAALRSSDGATVLGESRLPVNLGTGWTKLTMEITATGSAADACFYLTGSAAGRLCLDMVSLFPPTYMDRENGCRIDLARMLKAMKPAFVRFPGGCFVEGQGSVDNTNRFEWKKTIGPIEERPGHRNVNWNYDVTDGLGFHELLQLTEDLGAEPLFVVNIGIGHGWLVDYRNIDEFIQEALDAIEYCNGDVNTTWGAKRAANGHPEPFNLRLMEIGNENYNFSSDNNSDQSDHYAERYDQFYRAIKAKYPEVTLIGNVESWGTDNPSWRNTYPVEVVDEHYYRSPSWFVKQYGKYDNYSRSHYKVYAGEYAVTQNFGTNGNLNAALGEAVYMMGMENNSDVCVMSSYAPIFTHESNYNWKPDMIRFNSSMSYGTPSYHVQQMMPNNVGKVNVKWTEEDNVTDASAYKFGLSTWSTVADFDNVSIKTADGTVFSDDFSTSKSQWSVGGGTWSVNGGVLSQTQYSNQGGLYICNVNAGSRYTFEVDATKTYGAEGFLIAFNYQDANNYCWWNLGGWNNSAHGVEVCVNGSKTTVANVSGSLVTGKTYHIKIDVDGSHVCCYLDDALIHEFDLPSERKIYVASSIDDEAGKMYIKLANPSGTAASANIRIANATVDGGTVVMLGSTNGTDENTTANPAYVSPKERTLDVSGNSFTYTVPAYSLHILCLDVSGVTLVPEETVTLPEPVVEYDFERGLPADKGGVYTGSLKGGATIVSMDDGNKVLYTGLVNDPGYMSLGADMAARVVDVAKKGNFTISMDIQPTEGSALKQYSWAFGICDGTAAYCSLISAANNTDWYYSMNSGANGPVSVNSGGGLNYNVWHNLTYVQDGTSGRLYVDGYLLGEKPVRSTPSDLDGRELLAYLGYSPFSDDAPMAGTYMDNLCVYDCALTAAQVGAVYKAASAMETASAEKDGLQATAELNSITRLMTFLHADTDLPEQTADGKAVTWALSSLEDGYVALSGRKLTVNKLAEGEAAHRVATLTGTIDGRATDIPVSVAPDDNRYGYLYCFMNSGVEITNYALGTKEDKGKVFNVLLGGAEIFDTEKAAEIEGGTRDAYIGRGQGTDGFAISTTDMCNAKSGVWRNYGMNLHHSDDLIHWTSTTFDFRKGKSVFSDPEQTTDCYKTDAEYANINRVWAPQWIWDAEAQKYMVYYSLLSSNEGDNHDKIYYSYTDAEFKTLTQPRLLFDPGYAIIDADIVWNPYDKLYHMYYKREGANGTGRGPYEAVRPSLTSGEWTDILHVTNEGSELVEGASTVRRINEDVYNLYYMRYSGGSAYKVCETDHLGLNPTGSAAVQGEGSFQHGSIMTLTEAEYKMLQAWDEVMLLLPKVRTLAEAGNAGARAAVTQAEAALELTSIDRLAAELPIVSKALSEAFNQAIKDGDLTDLTSLITNPDFTDRQTGWEGTPFWQTPGTVAEFWNMTFDAHQTLANLPAGKYRLECQGFHRNGSSSAAYADYVNGTETSLASIYINDAEQPIQSIYSDYAQWGSTPTDVRTSDVAFNTDGRFTGNSVTYVLEEDGPLTIGLRQTVFKGDSWTCFDNFRLYYDGPVEKEELTGYLFTYFTGNNPDQEQLRFALSRNGYDYTPLLNSNPVVDLTGIGRFSCIRDPHILRGEKDGMFYMVGTDMKSNLGWSSNDGLYMLKSADLVHWDVAAVDFPTAFPDLYDRESLTQVWAPQTIWDNKAGKYMVYYTIGTTGTKERIFYSYANADFTSIDEPKLLLESDDNIIDADIVKLGDTYHMFLAGIYKSTASDLTGPWAAVNTSKKYQQTTLAAEGPGIFPVNNTNEWILMYDCYRNGFYQFCKSTDLENFELVAQTATSGDFTPRHGTVIGLSEKEYSMLQDWSDVMNLLPEVRAMAANSSAAQKAVTRAENALALRSIDELSEALPVALQSLQEAGENYLAELKGKLERGEACEITLLLENPDFAKGADGWNGTSLTAAPGTVAEQFNKVFNNYQILADMPAGRYRLTVQGFYRMGDKSAAYGAHSNGTEKLNATIYLNDVHAPFMSLYDEEGYTYSPYTYPDGVTGADAAFRAGDYAGNTVEVVLSGRGDLRVGMSKTVAVGNDWTCFDNFRLYYEGVPDAVAGVKADADETVCVHSINGVLLRSGVKRTAALDGLPKGVYIVDGNKVVK